MSDELLRKVWDCLNAAAKAAGGQDWGKLFNQLGTRGDGQITFEELLGAMRERFGVSESQMPADVVRAMFNQLDKDRRGSIDTSELVLFVAQSRKQAGKADPWGAELALCHRKIHKAAKSIGGASELFKMLDKNKDGKLEPSELQAAIRKIFGIPTNELPNKAISTLFTYLDKDNYIRHKHTDHDCQWGRRFVTWRPYLYRPYLYRP